MTDGLAVAAYGADSFRRLAGTSEETHCRVCKTSAELSIDDSDPFGRDHIAFGQVEELGLDGRRDRHSQGAEHPDRTPLDAEQRRVDGIDARTGKQAYK
jgi:hypothetical protein